MLLRQRLARLSSATQRARFTQREGEDEGRGERERRKEKEVDQRVDLGPSFTAQADSKADTTAVRG